MGVVNGVLYAVGGYNNGDLATVEAYDPVANTWTTVAPMPMRRGSGAVGVVNGLLYAVGRNSPTIVAYDPVANSWTAKAAMPTPRSGLAAGVVNGVVYALGGMDLNESIVGAVEAYHP